MDGSPLELSALLLASGAFCVKYFPHYDGYLQGERAARTLVRAIKGDYEPAHVTLKVPIISPTVCSGPARRHGWIWCNGR
jgi:microcystin degradation protein MlrC